MSDNKLFLINNLNSITLNKEQALQLELTLNLSEYGKAWTKIGVVL
tara:strand:- start:118 stop:255 length:138 start_codon:yes stop_codon:yes gene_type:complete